MIEHIVLESAKLFKGTTHESDWVFYHDALNLLTATSTIEWMKETYDNDGKSYYDRWIHPMGGLNSGTDYDGRPVGNSPEMMPWDASLNKDVDDCVARHVAMTSWLKEGDEGYELRYSRATPKLQGSAYRRVLDPAHGRDGGAPSSKRIIQDIDKFLPCRVRRFVLLMVLSLRALGAAMGIVRRRILVWQSVGASGRSNQSHQAVAGLILLSLAFLIATSSAPLTE